MERQRRLSAALQGECQLVVVAGEEGIGKSRLLNELDYFAKTKKIQTLHGRFVEENLTFPYQGFCEMIQEYFRSPAISAPSVDFSDLASDLRAFFPVLSEIGEVKAPSGIETAGFTVSPKIEDRTLIFELLSRSFIRLAAGKPLVLLLEDLHTADVSIEALQYIVRRLAMTPTLIVASYRTTEVDRHHPLTRMLQNFQGDKRFLQFRLEPFTPAEHRAFLETIIGSADLDDGLDRTLYEATEGNPYFTKELVRSLIDTQGIAKDENGMWALTAEAGISTDALPPTVQQIVEKRIERLPE